MMGHRWIWQVSFCSILFFTSSFAQEIEPTSNGKEELVMANVIFRHGNRTPTQQPYPNDPYRSECYWPIGWGQLTDEGMLGQYKLGKWLRKRYDDLLPREYNRNDTLVQCSDVDRTLMSAECNLAGLYEPEKSDNWNPNIKWRPIPVHITPKINEGTVSCAKYFSLLQKLWERPHFQKIVNDNKALFKYVENAIGAPVDNLPAIFGVYDTLNVENLKHLPLPAWTKKVFPEPMRSLGEVFMSSFAYTPKLARLFIGPLLKEIVGNMESKTAGNLVPDRKLFMYSGHDITIAGTLQGLGVYNSLLPPYCSAVLIELYKVNNGHSVKVLYRNSSLTEPFLLKMPGCGNSCPLDKFFSLLKPVLPDDWESECGAGDNANLTLADIFNSAQPKNGEAATSPNDSTDCDLPSTTSYNTTTTDCSPVQTDYTTTTVIPAYNTTTTTECVSIPTAYDNTTTECALPSDWVEDCDVPAPPFSNTDDCTGDNSTKYAPYIA